jgi:hypothetical protein
MVENFRMVKGKALSLEYRDYTSSKGLSAEQALSATRKPWGIGCQHERRYMPEIQNNGAKNLAYLRHMALNILQKEPTKLSIVGKQEALFNKSRISREVLNRRIMYSD